MKLEYSKFKPIKTERTIVNVMAIRRCITCGEFKFSKEFKLDKRRIGGRRNTCTKCYQAKYGRKYKKQYYEQNREKWAGYEKQYREQNREKIADYKKQYSKQNREKIAERQKQYIDNLSDAYIKRLLSVRSTLTVADVTPELIMLKRLEITVRRKYR